MTQKERLYREMASLNNELFKYGKKSSEINADKAILYREHTALKVDELKRAISSYKSQIESYKEEKKREDFYNTENGKAVKEYLENLKLETCEKMDSCHGRNLDILQELLDNMLGKGFKVKYLWDNSLEFAKVDENGNVLFGHDWSVYRDTWTKDADLVINYPTLGCFNPMTDYNRVAYLEGLAKFAKPENVKKIKNFMDNYNKEFYNLREIISNIDNKLKNPYDVEVA